MLAIVAGVVVAFAALAWVLWPIVRPAPAPTLAAATMAPTFEPAPATPTCPRCGPRPEPDARVCSTCGTPL